MNKKELKKIGKFIIPYIISKFIKKSNKNNKNKLSNNLLLLRLDRIGDYILFRNYIDILKKNKNYKKYQFTLCGNIAWKELANNVDNNSVDKFIWVNREKFITDIFYTYNTLNYISKQNFEIAIHPTFSREFFADTIMNCSNAQHRIGSIGDCSNINTWQKNISDTYYTELINAKDENLFEFNRNREFFENLLETKLDIQKPLLDISKIKFNAYPQNKFIVIFPGARKKFRMWDINKFSLLADFIIKKFNYDIVIAGSKQEKYLANKLLTQVKSNKVFDLTGKITLSQFAKLLSRADLLISNDTSVVHMAVAVDTRIICLSNGNTFGRFVPYPTNIFEKIYYLYPSEIRENLNNFDDIIRKYKDSSDLNINNIGIEEVEDLVKNILSEVI